jgi:bacterioferritin
MELELELAGVARYVHYSLMIYGYNRIPIVDWMKSNAQEGLTHAHRAGELMTLLGASIVKNWLSTRNREA